MSFSYDFAFEFPLPKSPRSPASSIYSALFGEDDTSDDYPASPPSRTVRAVSAPRYYTPESGLESDEESDEDSNDDSDDERWAAECAAMSDAKDSGPSQLPVAPMVPRVVLPLPRRVSPEASPAPASRRSTRRSSSPVSSDYSPTPNPRKRKTAANARPPRRAAKKAAIASATFSDLPVALPVVLSVIPRIDAGPVGSPLPGSDVVPPQYWYLLKNGCTPAGQHGLRCNVKDTPTSDPCMQVTGSYGDMPRHLLHHYPDPLPCPGCPVTYARNDSLVRHHTALEGKGDLAAHTSEKRVAFMKVFLKRPEVVQRKEDCQQEWEQDFSNTAPRTKCNNYLKAHFEKLWAKA
ncbi:hypothetical protein C8R43DRAFT_1101145 [Mycena crocata]|nr:hypothetical protein C8R43DRAFT_1101145 [Mycena crocata]